MKLYLALFSCEKYKKMQAQRITCTVLNLHTCREKENKFFYPTSEKNPEQQNKESEMFHCTQDTVGVMASCSFSKP